MSDARASDCTNTECLSGIGWRLEQLRAESRLRNGTLDPVIETATLDTEFTSRISFLQNRRDFSAIGTRTTTRNSFLRGEREISALSTETVRISRLFGRLDRNRFNPQIFIETPEQSIYTADMIETRYPEIAAVPLPATLPLILAGFGGLALIRKRRRSA